MLDDARARGEDREVVLDLLRELLELAVDLVATQGGEALQAQIEDGAGLLVREADGAVVLEPMARIGDQIDQRADVLGRPGARHHLLACLLGARGAADQADHLVDVGDGDREAHQYVRAVARLGEQVLGAPRHHLLAERGEGGDHVLEVELLRAPAVDGQHIGAEARLQVGVAPQLVQHHVGNGVALQLDDDAHAFAVGLVPDVGDALDLLLAHLGGDLLDQRLLAHLVGDRGDDEGLAVLADLLGVHLGAHDDGAAALVVGSDAARAAKDQRAGREVRPWHDLDQLVDADLGIVEVGDAGVDHLAQVVRRDVGGHADRDAARAVDQEVGKRGRHDRRLPQGAVVVVPELHSALVEVGEHGARDLGEPALRIALGRRRIVVDGAEVALAVHQHDTQREILRHAHQRVVDRQVAVRVVFAHHLADHTGALHVLLVVVEPQLVHAEQDAPVHRLEAVANVGQRARHDHAHGVIEVAALHLVGDGDRPDVDGALPGAFAARGGIVVSHW